MFRAKATRLTHLSEFQGRQEIGYHNEGTRTPVSKDPDALCLWCTYQKWGHSCGMRSATWSMEPKNQEEE